MARWLPSGLSSLSGQISNFTKEVLADGVEEVDDHATELREAKARIAELERISLSQKAESQRLKQLNDELGVQLHSQELEKVTLSNHYRTELAAKEQQIKSLLQKQSEFFDQRSQGFSVFSSGALSDIGLNEDSADDIPQGDLDDLIASQHKINYLHGEVCRLTAEVQHWQSVASQSQEVQQCLNNVAHNHQVDTSSAQNSHLQDGSSSKSLHSKSPERFERNIEVIAELDRLRQELQDMKTVRLKLEYDLEHIHAADHKKAIVISQMSEELNALKMKYSQIESEHEAAVIAQRHLPDTSVPNADLSDLAAKLSEMNTEVETLNSRLLASSEENVTLKLRLQEMLQQVESHKRVMDDMKRDLHEKELHIGKMDSHHKHEMDEQCQRVEDLTCKVGKLEGELSAIRLEKETADTRWKITVDSLLAEKMELEQRLSNVEEKYKETLQQITASSVKQVGAHMDNIRQPPCTEPELQSTVEQKLSNLRAENESLKENLEEIQSVCKLYEAEVERLTALEEQLTLENNTIIQSQRKSDDENITFISAQKDEIASLRAQLTSKTAHLEQQQEQINELNVTINGLTAETEEMKKQLSQQVVKIDEAAEKNMGIHNQCKACDENATMKHEIATLQSQLTANTVDFQQHQNVVDELNMKITGLTTEVEELRLKLSQQQMANEEAAEKNTVTDKCKECDESIACISALKDEVATLQSQVATKSVNLEQQQSVVERQKAKINELTAEVEELRSKLLDLENDVKNDKQTCDGSSIHLLHKGECEANRRNVMNTKSMPSPAQILQIENEARELRSDRERLLTVLEEKTRESGALRAEVHRLTSIAAASQSALHKAHSDTQSKANSLQSEANQDMKNEAVRKLSQLIRDKDVEIEALKLKNATLTQVLHDSVPDGDKLASMFAETDSLRTQVTMYQRDREQLITALTNKHQESVGFYEESRRLQSQVAQLVEERENYICQYNQLTQQYEETKRSLCTVLNDLAAEREHHAELEQKLQSHLADTVSATSDKNIVANEYEQPNLFGNAGDSTAADIRNSDNGDISLSLQIDSLKLNLQQCHHKIAEKDSLLSSRMQHISELEQSVTAQRHEIDKKQRHINDISARLHQAEEQLSTRNTELLITRKQCESSSFELQGAHVAHAELAEEREILQHRVTALSAEIQAMQASYNALKANADNKEFELNSLREHLTSLQKVVETGREHSHDEQHKEELRMLSGQLETVRIQAQTLVQERDDSYMAVHQLQAENTELRKEVTRLAEKEQRLMKECERLRSHLLQMEDSYTRDAVEAEEREKQLRNRLSAAEERASSSSSAIYSAQKDSARQLENLQIQLHTVAEQRDNALLQLSAAQETISSYASSLSNLQIVLEQFQAERQQQQSLEVERYRRDLEHERDQARLLRQQVSDLQNQLDEASDALEAAHRLSEQLDRKDAMICALREEVQLRETQLAKAEEQLRQLSSNTESKIDKMIIKNLLFGYFHTPPAKRHEALRVIGQVLSYSRDEMKELTSLNTVSEGSWIGGLFRRKQQSSNAKQSSSPSHANPYHSFSELFVQFLEHESSPQPAAVRLPTERMIQEQQDRQQRRTTPSFNPFSTAIITPSTPTGTGDRHFLPLSTDSQHPLMRPITPSQFPVFAAATSAQTGESTVSHSEPSYSNGSGRSTPYSSSTALHDILQQR